MPSTFKSAVQNADSLAPHSLTCSVVIATRNRPEPIHATLTSLNRQISLPDVVVIVDSSDGNETARAVEGLEPLLKFKVIYRHTEIKSAARQRNMGAEHQTEDIIIFLDDDLELEPACLNELLNVFQEDPTGQTGGVSATITNQVYSDPRGLNRLLLAFCLGSWNGPYAGRLLGPAVNFLPEDIPDMIQQTDWLPSTCTAYRRDVFLQHRFSEFEGYSFAEDVDISSRIAKSSRLLNTTRARVFHHDLGKGTHRDWRTLGKSMVMNRHGIMTRTMGRTGLLNNLRLFWFEMIYSSLTWLAAGANRERRLRLMQLLLGKAAGFVSVWFKS
jgi:GT2 family glycosyltransferase